MLIDGIYKRPILKTTSRIVAEVTQAAQKPTDITRPSFSVPGWWNHQ